MGKLTQEGHMPLSYRILFQQKDEEWTQQSQSPAHTIMHILHEKVKSYRRSTSTAGCHFKYLISYTHRYHTYTGQWCRLMNSCRTWCTFMQQTCSLIKELDTMMMLGGSPIAARRSNKFLHVGIHYLNSQALQSLAPSTHTYQWPFHRCWRTQPQQ